MIQPKFDFIIKFKKKKIGFFKWIHNNLIKIENTSVVYRLGEYEYQTKTKKGIKRYLTKKEKLQSPPEIRINLNGLYKKRMTQILLYKTFNDRMLKTNNLIIDISNTIQHEYFHHIMFDMNKKLEITEKQEHFIMEKLGYF